MMNIDLITEEYLTDQQKMDILELRNKCLENSTGKSRRPRTRKIIPGHIPRPMNSFLSYRTEKQSVIRKYCPTANHRDISKIVAKWWRALTETEKEAFREIAQDAKSEHTKKYPGYKFTPKKRKQKSMKPSTSTETSTSPDLFLKMESNNNMVNYPYGMNQTGEVNQVNELDYFYHPTPMPDLYLSQFESNNNMLYDDGILYDKQFGGMNSTGLELNNHGNLPQTSTSNALINGMTNNFYDPSTFSEQQSINPAYIFNPAYNQPTPSLDYSESPNSVAMTSPPSTIATNISPAALLAANFDYSLLSKIVYGENIWSNFQLP